MGSICFRDEDLFNSDNSKRKTLLQQQKLAIQTLNQTNVILEKRIVYLEKRCKALTKEAVNYKLNMNQHKRALQCLAKKALLMKQITALGHYCDRIFETRTALEQINIVLSVTDALKSSFVVLQKFNVQISNEKIEDLLNETEEQMEIANEMVNKLSEINQDPMEYYKDSELEELEQELLKLEKSTTQDFDNKHNCGYSLINDNLEKEKSFLDNSEINFENKKLTLITE